MLMFMKNTAMILMAVAIILSTTACKPSNSQAFSSAATSTDLQQTEGIPTTENAAGSNEISTEPTKDVTAIQTPTVPEATQPNTEEPTENQIPEAAQEIPAPQSTKEETAQDASANYENILSGIETFFYHDYQKYLSISEYLDAFASETGMQPKITQYTILDMDGDAVPELLLWIVVNDYSDYGTVVLHTQNDNIEGYTFVYRQLFDLKADGSFALSGSESSSGYATLQFAESAWKYIGIPDIDQDAKEPAEWIAYPNT